jgi:GAF domain-containing protein
MTNAPLNVSPEQIKALHELVLATDTLQEFLDHVACQAADIGPNLSCGITVSTHPRRPLTVGCSDATAATLDETQYSHDDGPCLEAMRTKTIIEVTDVPSETRWGPYITRATGQGLRASLSIPITANGETLGVMNIYATTPATFTPEQRASARTYADHAAAAIALAARLAHHTQLTGNLNAALASRTIIDQAMGIIMGQRCCHADDAFALLRRISQDTNVKLRDVATALIIQTTGAPPQPTPPIT